MTDITPEMAMAIVRIMEEKRLMFRFGQAARMLDMGTDRFFELLEIGDLPELVKPGTGAWRQTRVDAIPLLLLAVKRDLEKNQPKERRKEE